MNRFLDAQADDPFDPAPILIQADWLEEEGDIAGAHALRGLAAAGYATLAMLALGACADSILNPDDGGIAPGTWQAEDEGGQGNGDRFPERLEWSLGGGHGDSFAVNSTHSSADGEGLGAGDGFGIFLGRPTDGRGIGTENTMIPILDSRDALGSGRAERWRDLPE